MKDKLVSELTKDETIELVMSFIGTYGRQYRDILIPAIERSQSTIRVLDTRLPEEAYLEIPDTVEEPYLKRF